MYDRKNIIKKNYDILKSIYIDKIVDIDKGFYSISDIDYNDTNPFWNHRVCFNQTISDHILRETKSFYEQYNYRPTIYIPDYRGVQIPSCCEEVFVDAWMFAEDIKSQINTKNKETDTNLVKVESEDDIDEFIELFYLTHSGDLDDPYAGLSDAYGEQMKRKYKENSDINLNFYFIEHNKETVGHRIIALKDDIAYLTTLGIVPGRRNEGIGTEAIYETIKKVKQEYDSSTIYFQTEKGSKNERYFCKRGFNTRFSCTGYTW